MTRTHYSLMEVVRRLDLTPAKVRQLDGPLRASRDAGGRRIYPRSAVERFLAEGGAAVVLVARPRRGHAASALAHAEANRSTTPTPPPPSWPARRDRG